MAKVKDYLRLDKLPHIWCPGCGDGTILGAMIRSIDSLGYDRDNVAMITGIGCSARTNAIVDFNTIQTTHGRALSFATGFKLAKPEMKVIVVTGDGDGSGIGGNHLIHTARRNIDMTMILINNSIYGMTGGQYSPLTPHGYYGTTAPYGNVEYPFDVCDLVRAAGATYVARATVYHVNLLQKLVTAALEHKGFSFIEVVSQCPIGFGRKNKMGSPYNMLLWQKEHAVTAQAAGKLSAKELKDKFIIGELYVNNERKEFIESYSELKERVMGSKKGGGVK